MEDPFKSWAVAGFLLAFLLPIGSFLWHICPRKKSCNGLRATLLISSSLLCMIAASWMWLNYVENPTIRPIRWITLPSSLIVSFSLDFSSSVLVLSSCTLFVSTLVHIYSVPYMRDSESRDCYFGILGLFTSAMLGLFWSTNLWGLLLFWSMVGICSYILIGHNYKQFLSAKAAQIAMLFSKSADIGLIVGVALLSVFISRLDIDTLRDFFSDPFKQQFSLFNLRTGICGLMFAWAAFGKSAQFPFHSWLIAAMRAPTPVSALLHSATLVAAGVFLLARMSFLLTPWLRDVLLIVGLSTSIFAALSAFTETHSKRLLAFSTISQLGLMISLVAIDQTQYAFVYLVVHAVAKVLLFLAVGVIVRHLSTTTKHPDELPNMGGLWRSMPLPYLAMICGSAVLLGLPLSAGYLVKPYLIAQLWSYGRWVSPLALLALLCTGLYVGRLLGYLFFQVAKEKRDRPQYLRPWHQPALQLPLLVGCLGCLSFFYQYPTQHGEAWLVVAMQQSEKAIYWTSSHLLSSMSWLNWLPFGAAILGVISLKHLSYDRKDRGALAQLFYYYGYVRQMYEYFWQAIRSTSYLLYRIENRLFVGFGERLAEATLLLALSAQFVEKHGLSKSVEGLAKLIYTIGHNISSFAKRPLPVRIRWALLLGLSLLWMVLWLLYF